MSSPGAPTSAAPHRRQKRMGPAPFASFEDLSDELDSPEDKHAQGSVVRLPGIREDVTPCSPTPQDQIKPEFVYTGISLIGAPSTPTMTSVPLISTLIATPAPTPTSRTNLQTPSAPRIDISRASSSSHHDSKDSSPDRELFCGGNAPDANANVKLGLGFREEGTLDLRSSTEELDYQEVEKVKTSKIRAHSPVNTHEDSYHSHQRKDSQSSEIGLLCISGRTSRLSSIGSQGSAHSRISNASHLSVISGQSGLSRSPSPHKMLLETSFCGTKPQRKTQAAEKDEGTKEELEIVLLKRNHDPTQALLAEGIIVESPKPEPKKMIKSDITITVDKPPPNVNNDIQTVKLPKHIVSKSGVEYIYIPLKGPLPEETKDSNKSNGMTGAKTKVRETKSASLATKPISKDAHKHKSKSATPSPIVSRHEEPQYIRIKLKPDHLYEDYSGKPSEYPKPDSLDLTEKVKKPAQTFEQIISYKQDSHIDTQLEFTPTASPNLGRHLNEPISKSPSPSLSRKSSFASIFKSRETISPESPTVPGRRKNVLTDSRERRRSRSKSRDRSSMGPSSTESIDSKGKPKSMFSIFKKKKDIDTSTPDLPNLEGLVNVQFKFSSDNNLPKKSKPKYYEPPLEGASVRIPLHSPTYYDHKNNVLQDFKTSSQDSQETVIEVALKHDAKDTIETVPEIKNAVQKKSDFRQSSTSSENIVFSTRIGSSNEIFSTKLPKETDAEKEIGQTTTAIVETQRETELEVELRHEIEEAVPSTSREIIPVHVPESVPESVRESVRESVPVSIPISVSNSVPISVPIPVLEPEQCSSESERDSECADNDDVEPERKGLVLQQDSFEDELPYVPTTLPLERSVAVPIVPVKQRSTFEMKTCPIERPRSTTPIHPTCLEDYCEDVIGSINTENITKTIEKLRIYLPRDDNGEKQKDKSPRRTSTANWFDFSKITKKVVQETPETPPPLPPKGVQKEWINFEDIPEKRKPPKRIQTIPSRGNIDVPESVLQENVIYTYVNPEDCKCECHDRVVHQTGHEEDEDVREDEMPLLDDDAIDEEKPMTGVDTIKLDVTILDRRSIVSDSSVDLSVNVEHADANGIDHSLQTPFTSDLGISSNRSSIISQEDVQSPDTDSPNAFPKKS